jgi:hypothetical protein
MLGAAELTLPSRLGAGVTQRVWPNRGIVVHSRRNDSTPLIIAFPAMSAARFEETGIAVLPDASAEEEP